ncbi:MAG TPA: AgmX/PglI C-terminal domain-containing protein [Myxococcota bacterium]|nr:AgmX/PglI C-terminal domain-containing protein [Myxococcota bacterium]
MPVFLVLLAACGSDSGDVATATIAPVAGHIRLAPVSEPLVLGIEFGEVDPSEVRVEWSPEGEDTEAVAEVVTAESEGVVAVVSDFVEDVGARWKDDSAPEPAAIVVEEVAEAVVAPETVVEAPKVDVLAQLLGTDPLAEMSVDQVIRRYSSQAQYCHETAKERYSEIEGRVSVAWTVEAGVVKDVEILDDTTGDPQMAGCVARKVRYWRFPAGMDAEVEHPFVFQRAI